MITGTDGSIYVLLSVSAHVFVEPFTPPLPLLVCLIAAGLTIVVSFVLVISFARNAQIGSDYPRINLLQWKAARILNCPGASLPIQLSSVFLFVLLVLVGFLGNPDPIYNLAPTFIWVIWWVGVAYVSAFLGDVWSLINPWKIIFGWAEQLWGWLSPGKPFSPVLHYPARFGVWPGLLLFLAFAWVENVYGDAVIPSRISQMILVYSGITWIGMFLFGKEIWLRHGETFSLAFGFLAKFAPIETRLIQHEVSGTLGGCGRVDFLAGSTSSGCSGKEGFIQREINLRPFASGLLNIETVSISQMLFVLLLLATVTFDGFMSTLPWINIQASVQEYLPNVAMISTLGLVSFGLIFIALYLFFCALMSLASGIKLRVLDVAKAFVYTLIPIALAYHLAHFMLFLLIQGQLIVPLASDPFGFGWDLFGTADYRLNFSPVGPSFYWFISVIAIVTGHIIAVFLAHSIAFRLIRTRRYALRSQFPMLVLMVGYTVASLWIITQPMYM